MLTPEQIIVSITSGADPASRSAVALQNRQSDSEHHKSCTQRSDTLYLWGPDEGRRSETARKLVIPRKRSDSHIRGTHPNLLRPVQLRTCLPRLLHSKVYSGSRLGHRNFRGRGDAARSEMTLGTGKLLTDGGFTPAALQQRVAVPGGITEEGLRIMEKELCSVFYDLIRTTHAKYEEDLEKVEARFFGTKADEERDAFTSFPYEPPCP